MQSLLALIKLCDDPSPVVAEKVARRLRELGPGVWDEIAARDIVLSDSQREALVAALAVGEARHEAAPDTLAARDTELREVWEWLAGQGNEHRYLEGALLALCDWQNGGGTGARGRLALDALAIEFGDYDGSAQSSDAAALAQFLFEEKGLRGADAGDYYNPQHSNLVYALEEGRALPITLACVFILVGRRLGLEIEGCSFPGHFLARDGRSDQVFDPFNGGRVLSPREVDTLFKAAPSAMSGPASAREIVARVLRNLSTAYFQLGDSDKAALMLALLHDTDGEGEKWEP